MCVGVCVCVCVCERLWACEVVRVCRSGACGARGVRAWVGVCGRVKVCVYVCV